MPLPAHCPDCGAPVAAQADGSGRCSSCCRAVHAHSRPTAGVLLERAGKILLVRRAAEPAKGMWDVPGGYLLEGERPEDGARRELREELGIELGRLRLALAEVNPLADGAVLDLIYEGSDFTGEPHPGSDVAECAWFDPGHLPEPLAFPATARILERWRSSRRVDGLRLLGGETLGDAEVEEVAWFAEPLTELPLGWRAECGDWRIHDGALCGRVAGEAPAAFWLEQPIAGDHMLRFTARAIAPASNDLNCYWEGAGRILGGDAACTIGGVAGWWDGLTGIERHPEGGLRATTRVLRLDGGTPHEVVGGRRGPSDFLFVDGCLALELDDPGRERRATSRVALATWNSHVHFAAATVYRLRARR